MKKEYKIGMYKFDSFETYQEGLHDFNIIKQIMQEIDLDDLEAVLRIYNLICNKKIVFISIIGEHFFLKISDIISINLQSCIEEDKIRKRIYKRQKIIGIICILIAIVCCCYFGYREFIDYQNTKNLEELRELKSTANTEETDISQQASSEPVILQEYKDIYAKNSDLVGWITIDGTQIDYPVMQSKEVGDFYLSHNFDKQEDSNGCLFIEPDNNVEERDTNLIIYGHNMKNGAMFGTLKNYLNQDYWSEHQTIKFDTTYEKGSYQIIAVCLSKVAYQDEDVFRYYDFYKAKTKEEYDNFINNIKQLEVFDTGIDTQYGDTLITLSTCNSYTEDGRLFVVAKKI